MPQKRKIVSVNALCKDFQRPNGNVFTVLEGINLDVFEGEFLTILGISGSGKTTLLKCMAGLLDPDRGQVNYIRSDNSSSQLLSFVFQNFALFPWLTVRENIEIAIHKVPWKIKESKVDDFLELVGLKGFEDCFPRELSGGMRQRVSLCRALIGDPMVVFMDEPFSSLDPLTTQSLRAEINRIWQQPDKKISSMVLVTHDLNEAILMSDRILILSSNPGSVFRTIDVPLPRPRNPSSPEYIALEQKLEKVFGELHLDRFLKDQDVEQPHIVQSLTSQPVSGQIRQQNKIRPLINASLVLVEGLVHRLALESEPMDLYDLCEEMSNTVDQMLPAVASSEILGLLYTPGTDLILTEFGKRFAEEQETEKRNEMLREACLKIPVIHAIYTIVVNAGNEGVEKEIALEQIAMMIPFEDPDLQFEALVKWCRHTNLLVYDAENQKLFHEP